MVIFLTLVELRWSSYEPCNRNDIRSSSQEGAPAFGHNYTLERAEGWPFVNSSRSEAVGCLALTFLAGGHISGAPFLAFFARSG